MKNKRNINIKNTISSTSNIDTIQLETRQRYNKDIVLIIQQLRKIARKRITILVQHQKVHTYPKQVLTSRAFLVP